MRTNALHANNLRLIIILCQNTNKRSAVAEMGDRLATADMG